MSTFPVEDKDYQKAILSDVTHTATFTTIFLNKNYLEKGDAGVDSSLKKLIGEFPSRVKEINKEIQPHIDSGFNKAGLLGVIGISSDVIKRLLPSLPADMHPHYRDLKGAQEYSHLPATGGEIFMHLKSDQKDACFNFLRRFMRVLKGIKMSNGEPVLLKSEEIDGFLHLFNTSNGLERDLTGFEDGTKNPKTLETKLAATVHPTHGGSFIIAQKWQHDLDSWEALSVAEQEDVFGRKKADSGRYAGKPASSHVALTDLGKKKGEILRHSLPFGDSTNYGLFFLGYSAEIKRFDEMLDNMMKASGMNPHLDLMKYIKCLTGQYYYAPSVTELNQMAQ
eukprot:Phypoly_transcript_12344.p1 GENE.Phypoly_transcript_12344~~Phypoly_transcript_12344.p1  ORF type:complete len:377 (+),score=58.27 Phypoly_transcript_12344:123-1133(+)